MSVIQLTRVLSFPVKISSRTFLLTALLVARLQSWTDRAAPAADATIPSGPGTSLVYIVLDGGSAAKMELDTFYSGRSVALAGTAQMRVSQVQARQSLVSARLAGEGIDVIGKYQRLANVIKARVPVSKLARVRSFPGVATVQPVRYYSRQTSKSIPFVGASQVWGAQLENADGTGVRIGFIDTGVDYTHADFGGSGDPIDYENNDPTRIEPGSFPTAKVVGGFDFAGNSYDPSSSDSARYTPFPDPDPLDCNGHGTHVAGIAAGYGVLTNGSTYGGLYSPSLEMSQFLVGPGIAPKAQIYALKIFGCDGPTDLILDALEWAADPNGDGSFEDHLDVVNLSLGSSFGQVSPDDVVLNAANQLAELGCVVVVAAGNSGNIYYTIAAPGVAERAVSVANSLDARFTSPALEILSPKRVAGLYEAVEASFTPPLAEIGPLTNFVVLAAPSKACDALTNAADLKGKIALIDRGTCLFSEKIARAEEAGAIAVIMVNNTGEAPFPMAGESAAARIPAVMVSKADGDILRSAVRSNLQVRLDASLTLPGSELTDQLSDFSSRGPSSPGSLLKPELTAPGEAIISASVGTGTNGVSASGTSMSTPHVAGAAALLKQLHPRWSVEEIKAALMNTAAPTQDEDATPYPESRVGAGRLQVDRAARTVLTASAENGKGLVSLSFGALTVTNAINETRFVHLTNHGTNAVALRVSVQSTLNGAEAELVPISPSAIVPPLGSVSLPFQLRADPSSFGASGDPTTPTRLNGLPRHTLLEVSGQIHFEGTNVAIHLPYHAILQAGADYSVTASEVGLPLGTNLVDAILPVRGTAALAKPLLSVFQLGAVSSNQHLGDPIYSAADVLAVGAASDFGTQHRVQNSTLFFGLVTAGSWTTPQSFLVDLEVVIDVDHDGVIDYVLANGSDGELADFDLGNPEVANDVFLTVVRDTLTDELFAGGFVNIYAANERETAPFNNSVLVLSVNAGDLGLTDSNPKFSYRVVARGPDGLTVVDQTPWVPYDVAKPAVDTALFGLEGYPTRDDGDTIAVRIDRVASAALDRPVELLLLHHFNPQGRRYQVVRFNLETDDADNDGISDFWELAQFGDLSGASKSTDFDGDGFLDLMEAKAGTDPKDATSLLRITSALPQANGQMEIQWSTVPGKLYALERATTPDNGAFVTVVPRIAAVGEISRVVDTNARSPGPYYYRVRLETPFP